MEPDRSSRRLLEQSGSTNRDSSLFPTNEEAEGIRSPFMEKKPLDKRSMDYIIRSGIAGGLAGCAAKSVVAPLDRVKILFQASNPQFQKYTGSWVGFAKAIRAIHKQEGVRGLFRGHSATLIRVFPYAGIKFLAYEQIRHVIIPDRASETSFRRFVSGSLAGVTSVFFTYPLEVIRVRLAFETKRDSRSSLSRICQQIYHERPLTPTAHVGSGTVAATAEVVHQVTPRAGLVNFYRGFSPTLLGMLPYAGMSFLTHDTIGDLLRHPTVAPYTILPSTNIAPSTSKTGSPTSATARSSRKTQLNAPAELTSGAIAGLVSQTSSYPLEVIRRRMQVGGAVGDGRRAGIIETASKIWFERGWRGFFVGLSIGYIKVVPMVATSFYAYERGKWLLGIDG